jgi:hypothetical protein
MNRKNTSSIKRVSEDASALVTRVTELKRIMDANKPYKGDPPTLPKTDTRSSETVKPSTPPGVILNTNQFWKH